MMETTQNHDAESGKLLIPKRKVGITGYGAYVPRYRLPGVEIARIWGGNEEGLPVTEKAVAGLDEDVITMSIEAARNALKRAEISPEQLRAVWVGSESHPYAVKPSGTVVAAIGMVGSGMADYAMAIGMDTAQGKPGDALEYTAASGGAAYIIGPQQGSLVSIEAVYSFVTDTPDFWRRQHAIYPEHGQRFTGEPAYFSHISTATSTIMREMDLKPADFAYAVFHQPNEKFPRRVAKLLGFKDEQIETGLLSPIIGNTYSGAAIIGLTAILDVAKAGDLILMTSYGSGAGSDAFVLKVRGALKERRANARSTQDYIANRVGIDYATYLRYRGEIVTG